MNKTACRICGNIEGNITFQTKEMMFGFRDLFNYVECKECGTVQIEEIPDNIEKYYPGNYYSYTINDPQKFSLKKWRHGIVYNQLFGNQSLAGRLVALFSSKPPVWMNRKYLQLSSKILDVGSGSGKLLLDMQKGGFTNLVGIDIFLPEDIHYEGGVNIYKKDFFDVTEMFDFIMFNHSFEHMDRPQDIFNHLYTILNKDSYAMIRIPVADSYSYKKYGADWVNLDPPRHFYLHTTKSIRYLAGVAGLELKETIYDSDKIQFYGSELYKRNLTLVDYDKGMHKDVFSKKQMHAFKSEVKKLNKQNEGDWACFYLYKP